MTFIRKMHLKGFLSFAPESQPIHLTALNVLIGPNGVGKSNFIEALELLHAAPTDFSEPIRIGGTAGEWLWKGISPPKPASISVNLGLESEFFKELNYRVAFREAKNRLEIVDEALEEATPRAEGEDDVFFYYRYQQGHPVINIRQVQEDGERKYFKRTLQRETIDPQQSVFSQKKDSDVYPEITRVAAKFKDMQIFREWSFGRSAPLRQAQPANLSGETLLPTLVNLGLVLNHLEHRDEWSRFLELMNRFLPRFKRVSTKVVGGSVEINLHEDGLKTPVPATRLSDGTIRFLALLAILLNPESTPLLCIEEPELGLHPDALAIIADLLLEASQKTQLIVTTHSDAMVSALTEHADSVLVSEYLSNGTEFRRLESEKLRHWLQKYKLGELWRIGQIGGNL